MSLPCGPCGGGCCGPVPFSPIRLKELMLQGIVPRDIETMPIMGGMVIPFKGKLTGTCVFYKGECTIYEHRPIICRVYGESPDLPCEYLKKKGKQRND